MQQQPFSVSVTSPKALALASVHGLEIVKEVLQRGIRQHLESGRDWFQSADLVIGVNECRFEGTYARVEVAVQGRVNDMGIPAKNFQAEVSAPVSNQTMALATGGLVGVVVQAAVDSALENLRSERPTPHPNALDQQILFQLLDHLDAAVGRTATPDGLHWNRFMVQRWIAGLAMFVAVLVVGLVRAGLSSTGLTAGLMFGALSAPLAFLLVHCLGLFTMPASFFTTETAGKKALLMTGVGSVGALRIVVILAMLMLMAAQLGVLFLVWGSANWD